MQAIPYELYRKIMTVRAVKSRDSIHISHHLVLTWRLPDNNIVSFFFFFFFFFFVSELSVTELVSRIIGYLKGNAKISADHNFWFSWSLERLCKQWMQKQCDIRFFLTLMMTSALVVEMWVTTTDNSPAQDYTHPDDQTTLLHVNLGFKTFTV